MINDSLSHLIACCQNLSVSFQFVLKEFIATFKILEELENFYNNTSQCPVEINGSPTRFSQCLVKLIGHEYGNENILSWGYFQGHLRSLHLYSASIARKPNTATRRIVILANHTGKALQIAQELQQTTKLLWSIPIKANKEVSYNKFKKLLYRLTMLKAPITKAVKNVLIKDINDENILFFMLRRKNDFESIYGKGSVNQIIETIFPNGIEECQLFLVGKYKKRGFGELKDLINQKIKALQ